jgi:helicase MOV-10
MLNRHSPKRKQTIAGRLFLIGVPNSHFSVIAIDEAGQAQEPEILVCLEGLVCVTTLVVLAGDHKQLGSVIRSTIASDNGLAMSMQTNIRAQRRYAWSS